MQNNWESIINPLLIQGKINYLNTVNTADGFYPGAYGSSGVGFGLKVKDIAGTSVATGYNNLRLKTIFENNTGFDFSASGWNGAFVSWSNAVYEQPYSNGMSTDLRMGANINATHPTNGVAVTKLKFEIWGTANTGIDTKLDEYEFSFNCYYRTWFEPFFLNKKTDFVYYQGSATMPTKNILMCFGGSFIIVKEPFLLSSTDINIQLGVQSVTNYETATLIAGSNPAIVSVGLNATVVQTLDVGVRTYDTPINFYYTDIFGDVQQGSSIQTFSIDVRAFQTTDIVIYALKDISGIITKNIALNHPALVASNTNITYTNTSVCNENLLANGTIDIIFDSASQALGIYNGSLSIFDNGVLRYIINIKVVVSDFLTTDYDFTKNGFTLDPKYFRFNTARTDTYFQFDALIETTNFFNGTAFLSETIKQKIVPFKGKAELNLGLAIHRLMHRFDTINTLVNQYKPATITINCEEKLLSNDTIINSTAGALPALKFLAGLGKDFIEYGFLNINHKPSRVTVKSFALLNTWFFYDGGNIANQVLRVFKNNVQQPGYTLLTTNSNFVRLDKILFSNFAPGDVVEYSLWDIPVFGRPVKLASKTYIVFPENRYSNMIVWEDEFLLQSAMEFTGSHSIKTDIEFVTQKFYHNLIEHLEILDTTKDVKLTINTGFLLKTDVDSVESLMRSRRVWLDKGNGETIVLRPLTKTLISEDSEQELIEYSIEFLINRKYNEETYRL